MKKSLLFSLSALLVLAGCTKEISDFSYGGDGLQEVTFTATLADQVTTKAADDGDGAAASVNRCIMEIYYNDTLYIRDYAAVGSDKKATFTEQLASNRTYTVAFWADSVASTDALETDLYYTTDAAQPDGGLQAIALKGTYAGNKDSRDAFFHFGSYTVEQGGSSFGQAGSEIYLKRPFAQVNVITTDWDKVIKVSSLKPDSVDVTIYEPLTKFDAVTGIAIADPTIQSLNYKASLYKTPTSGTNATISMDYIFAAADKAVIDIAWKAEHKPDADVTHSFTNIPYQRNYRTNIKGDLLTAQGKWTVTVDADWTDEYNEDVVCYKAESPAAVQTVLQQKAETSQTEGEGNYGKNAQVEVSGLVDGQENEVIIPDDVTSSNTPQITLTANNVPEDATLVIKDETLSSDTYKYEGTITLSTDAKKIKIATSKAHIEYTGDAEIVNVASSKTTFVVSEDSNVDEIIVNKGNVALKGTAGSIKRGEDLEETEIVYVDIYKTGSWTNEATESSSLLVARRPGFMIGDEAFFDLEKAFEAAQDDDVIVLANDINIYETVTLDNAVNVSIDLYGNTMTVNNDHGDGMVITGGATLNLTNSKAESGIYEFITTSWRYDGIFVYNTEADMTTTLNIQNPVKMVCNTAAQNSTVHAYAEAGKAVFNLHDGTEFIVKSTSGQQITAVMIDKNAEFNMDGGVFDLDVDFSSFSYGNDVVGVLLYGYKYDTNSVNISGGKFTVGGTNAFAQGIQLSYNNGSNPGNVVNVTGGEIALAENPGGESYAFTMTQDGTYNISGCKVTAADKENSALFAFQWGASAAGKRVITISSGEFFEEPKAAYIPFGYVTVEKDGVWTIEADPSLVYTENGKSFGPGIVFGDDIWAPVNCGESVEEGGLFYQWGRKDGQSKYALTEEQYGTSQVTDLASVDPTKFYKGFDNWYATESSQLWNAGTDEAPEKSQYDPCPEGWRVATYAEWCRIKTNQGSVVKNDGKYTYTTTNGQSISFPILGGRDGKDGTLYDSPFSEYAFCWASKDEQSDGPWAFMIYGDMGDVDWIGLYGGKSDGLPVRCVKIQ